MLPGAQRRSLVHEAFPIIVAGPRYSSPTLPPLVQPHPPPGLHGSLSRLRRRCRRQGGTLCHRQCVDTMVDSENCREMSAAYGLGFRDPATFTRGSPCRLFDARSLQPRHAGDERADRSRDGRRARSRRRGRATRSTLAYPALRWCTKGVQRPCYRAGAFLCAEFSDYLSGLGRADERTRTALLLITSVRSGVAGVCRGLQLPHI